MKKSDNWLEILVRKDGGIRLMEVQFENGEYIRRNRGQIVGDREARAKYMRVLFSKWDFSRIRPVIHANGKWRPMLSYKYKLPPEFNRNPTRKYKERFPVRISSPAISVAPFPKKPGNRQQRHPVLESEISRAIL